MRSQLEEKSYQELKVIAKEYSINPNQKKVKLIDAILLALIEKSEVKENIVLDPEEIGTPGIPLVDIKPEELSPADDATFREKEISEQKILESKMGKTEFFSLINTAIVAKMVKRIDVEGLYQAYCLSEEDATENAVINFCLKQIAG